MSTVAVQWSDHYSLWGCRTMKFGVFFELQIPRPWDEQSERRKINEAMEQAEFADKLGIDTIWATEHHFLEEYAHCTAPEVFLGALSQRTRRARLGHAVMMTIPQYNHPARIAERISTLDLVSGGRVEFGSGEGSSEAELGGFRINPATKVEAWEEGLRTAVRCMTETPFTGVEGEFVTMPPRNVVPKPVQKPHPPLWLACSRKETIARAARLGLGALSFSFIDPEDAVHWVEEYERNLMSDECVPIGLAVNPQLLCTTPMMVHESEAEAVRRHIEGANFFGYAITYHYIHGQHEPARGDIWEEFKTRADKRGFDPEVAAQAVDQDRLGAKIARGETEGLRGAIGSVHQVREHIRRYEEAGVDQLNFMMQLGKTKHEDIMESMELFATEIMPEFHDRDAEFQEKKLSRLAPALDAAMQRRPDTRRNIDGYWFPALPRAWDESGPVDTVGAKTATPERDEMIDSLMDRNFNVLVEAPLEYEHFVQDDELATD